MSSVQGVPSANASRLWEVLSHVHPNQLQVILQIFLNKLWRPKTEGTQSNAIQLRLIDKELDEYEQIDDSEAPPTNEPQLTLYQSPDSHVEIPPDILKLIDDEKALKKLLGHLPDSRITISDLKTFADKDKNFLNMAVYNANYKDAPLHKLVYESYVKGYGEKPLEIVYAPQKVEVLKKDNGIWLNCLYVGRITTLAKQHIPIEATCNYDLFNPKNATRSLMIHYPERV